MITRDLWQIWAPGSGKFLRTDFRSSGFAAGEAPRPTRWLAIFEEDPIAADMWTEAHARLVLADEKYPLQRDRLRLVPAPRCGCCGYTDGPWDDPRQLRRVVDSSIPSGRVYRCAKHVDRLPCIIEGCGRTFAMDPGDTYAMATCCGRHWRMAPRYMRDRVRMLRRKAEKLGWDSKAGGLHHVAWHRCIAAINRRGDVGGEGHIDIAEIERLFGK